MTDTETIRNQPPPPRPQFNQQQIRPNIQTLGPQGPPPPNQIRPQQPQQQQPNQYINTNGQPPRPAPPPQLRRVDSKGNLIMSSPGQAPQQRPQAPLMAMNNNRPPMPPNQMMGGQPRPQMPPNPQQQQQQNSMRPPMPQGNPQQNPQGRPPFPPNTGGPRMPGQHPVTAPNQPPFRPPFQPQQQQQPQQQPLQQQQQQQQAQPKPVGSLSKSDSNASMNVDPVRNQISTNKITYQITESEENGITMTKVIQPANTMVTLKHYASNSPEETPREEPEEEPPKEIPATKAIQQRTFTNLKEKKGDNDSGVDESTQEKERNGPGSPNSPVKSPTKPHSGLSRPPSATPSNKSSKSRSASRSRLLAKTPEPEPVKKVPMNKIKVGYAPSPDLKSVRSKIGSLDNSSYKPGGGQVKIETKRVEIKAAPRIENKNDKYVPKGGDKKIITTKLQWSAKSKIGSLENANHKPGGGDKKIETIKPDFKDKAKPKVGSKDNVKHVPGGGDIKEKTKENNASEIQTQKVELKAQSKIGSLDNVKHKPGGGDKKIFDDKDYLKNVEHSVALSHSTSQYYKAPSKMPRSQTITSEMSLPAECIVLSVSTPSINGSIRPKSAGARPIKKKAPAQPLKPFRLY